MAYNLLGRNTHCCDTFGLLLESKYDLLSNPNFGLDKLRVKQDIFVKFEFYNLGYRILVKHFEFNKSRAKTTRDETIYALFIS